MFYNVAKATKDKEKEKYADERKNQRRNNRPAQQQLRQKKLKEAEEEENADNFETTDLLHDEGEEYNDMEPGLFSRNFHSRSRSRSPRTHSRSRSRIRSGSFIDEDDPYNRGGSEYHERTSYHNDDGTSYHGDYNSDDDDDVDDFIHVPKCMLGKPLKDFDSGQDNVSKKYLLFV